MLALAILPVIKLLNNGGPVLPENAAAEWGNDRIKAVGINPPEVSREQDEREQSSADDDSSEDEVPHITADYSNSEHYASEICNATSNRNLIIIWVYTAPSNIDKRNKIRSTWGSVKTLDVTVIRTVFFVGAVRSSGLQSELMAEATKHRDIVQDTSYVDAYRNLTRKGISALYWIATHCPGTLRVIKVDDDTLVNPYNLVAFLRTSKPETLEKFICKTTQTSKPIRRPRSKYFVSVKEFDGDFYPVYCQGYGYMIPPNVIPRLLQGSRNITYLTMEDVYITGVLGVFAGVAHHALTPLYATTYVTSTEDLLKKIVLRKDLLFIGHSKSLLHYEMFWKLVTERRRLQ